MGGGVEPRIFAPAEIEWNYANAVGTRVLFYFIKIRLNSSELEYNYKLIMKNDGDNFVLGYDIYLYYIIYG